MSGNILISFSYMYFYFYFYFYVYVYAYYYVYCLNGNRVFCLPRHGVIVMLSFGQ